MHKIANSLAFIMALSVPAGGALAQPGSAVSIILTSYSFTPDKLELKAGSAYQLHLVNSDTKDHSFSAPAFFAASAVAADDQAKIKNGTVEVAGGQTIDITVTPGAAQSYAFTCTHMMHSMLGMHGTIAVQ
jgi:uncharacterized cupredoxin-like copper-binding protein